MHFELKNHVVPHLKSLTIGLKRFSQQGDGNTFTKRHALFKWAHFTWYKRSLELYNTQLSLYDSVQYLKNEHLHQFTLSRVAQTNKVDFKH